MRRLKLRVGYEEINGKFGVPKGAISYFTPHLEGVIVPFSGIVKVAA